MNSYPRARKLPSTENDVKALITQWFKDRKGFSFAVPSGHGMGKVGIADRVGVVPTLITEEMVGKHVGLFITVEAKAPGRRGEKRGGATQAQSDFLTDCLDAAGLAALVDSEQDLEVLDATLGRLRVQVGGDNPDVEARARLAFRTSGHG